MRSASAARSSKYQYRRMNAARCSAGRPPSQRLIDCAISPVLQNLFRRLQIRHAVLQFVQRKQRLAAAALRPRTAAQHAQGQVPGNPAQNARRTAGRAGGMAFHAREPRVVDAFLAALAVAENMHGYAAAIGAVFPARLADCALVRRQNKAMILSSSIQ